MGPLPHAAPDCPLLAAQVLRQQRLLACRGSPARAARRFLGQVWHCCVPGRRGARPRHQALRLSLAGLAMVRKQQQWPFPKEKRSSFQSPNGFVRFTQMDEGEARFAKSQIQLLVWFPPSYFNKCNIPATQLIKSAQETIGRIAVGPLPCQRWRASAPGQSAGRGLAGSPWLFAAPNAV